MKYVIGVDIGTSGTKAVAFSHQGEILASAYSSYERLDTRAIHHELDPDILYDAFIIAVSELIQQLKDKATLTAISLSSAMHGLLLIGDDHKPISALITWADLRSREQAKKLKNSAEGSEIYRLSGTPIHPMSPLSKIIWFKENEKELFGKTFKFISIKEYIIHKLTGRYVIDYSIASATGLFDIYRLDWNPKALALAGIRNDQLSEAVTTTYRIENVEIVLNSEVMLKKDMIPEAEMNLKGEVNPKGDLKVDSGLPQKIKTTIVIGASDGCLANLGTNAVRPGDVSLTIGTSGAVRMVSSKPQYDPKERIFNYVLTPDLFVSGGPINNGGVLLKWYTENFLQREVDDAGDFESFINTAVSVKPGSDGLIFLPYVQGERAPVWDADAKGVFFGITGIHTQAHFMRAIIEGICFSLLDVSLSLEETLGDIKNIYASGGFIKSPDWVQILCDVLGKKIHITDTADASSIGAAMLGMFATGIINDVADASTFLSIQKTYEPDPDAVNVYQKNFSIYRGLYDKLKSDF